MYDDISKTAVLKTLLKNSGQNIYSNFDLYSQTLLIWTRFALFKYSQDCDSSIFFEWLILYNRNPLMANVPPSYRNQSVAFQSKLTNGFLYDGYNDC